MAWSSDKRKPRSEHIASLFYICTGDVYCTQFGYNSTHNLIGVLYPDTPLKHSNGDKLKWKKVRNVFMKLYDVHNAIFSNQTEQFPKWSQWGHEYIMVMVEMNSNAILVKRITSQKDTDITQE